MGNKMRSTVMAFFTSFFLLAVVAQAQEQPQRFSGRAPLRISIPGPDSLVSAIDLASMRDPSVSAAASWSLDRDGLSDVSIWRTDRVQVTALHRVVNGPISLMPGEPETTYVYQFAPPVSGLWQVRVRFIDINGICGPWSGSLMAYFDLDKPGPPRVFWGGGQ